MTLSSEDTALLVGAVLGVLSAVGGVLTGDARYAELGTILVGIAGVLKATLGKSSTPVQAPPA